MLHKCGNKRIFWYRGVWLDGLAVLKKCPECKIILPDIHKLNRVEQITLSWQPKHSEMPPVEYKTLQVYKKERKKHIT